MLYGLRYARTMLMIGAVAAISLEAAAQAYSQRYNRFEKPFRPTNVRSDVDSDVYKPSTTRGGFNAYQGRRGTRNPQSRFFDIRREVVRPPTASERYRAAMERHEDRIVYDYGTQKYPSDHYDEVRAESYEAPERPTGIPRFHTFDDDSDSRMRIVTNVRRTRTARLTPEIVKDLNFEASALDRSLARTNIVEFRAVDGETVLTNEPEKYREDPAYFEVENHSEDAAESTASQRN